MQNSVFWTDTLFNDKRELPRTWRSNYHDRGFYRHRHYFCKQPDLPRENYEYIRNFPFVFRSDGFLMSRARRNFLYFDNRCRSGRKIVLEQKLCYHSNLSFQIVVIMPAVARYMPVKIYVQKSERLVSPFDIIKKPLNINKYILYNIHLIWINIFKFA